MARAATSIPPGDTRTELLNAAEELFAESGFAASSLRAITRQAGANLASVNYHFGSKEGLVREVFARRLRPLNRQRLVLLQGCLAQSKAKPSLRRILHAFVDPVLTMMHGSEPGQNDFVRILARTITEPGGPLQEMILEEFKQVIQEFTAAFAGALPKLSDEELVWRFHFMVGALAHTVASGHFARRRLAQETTPSDGDLERTVGRLIVFLEAGWQAPAAKPTRSGR